MGLFLYWAPGHALHCTTKPPCLVSAGSDGQMRITQQLATFYRKWVNIRPKTQGIISHKLKGRQDTIQEPNTLLSTSKSGSKDILSKQQIMSMEKYLQPGKCETSIIRFIFIPV